MDLDAHSEHNHLKPISQLRHHNTTLVLLRVSVFAVLGLRTHKLDHVLVLSSLIIFLEWDEKIIYMKEKKWQQKASWTMVMSRLTYLGHGKF